MTCRAHQAALWISISLVCVLALNSARAEDNAQAREALWLTDHAKLVNKLHALVIGDVDLKDATIYQVVDFLEHQSKLADPDHHGINFAVENQVVSRPLNLT